MTFFVDANVVIYSATDSSYRSACTELLRAVARGDARGVMSTATLEEVWHVELSMRSGDGLPGLTRHAYELFRALLPVTDAVFRQALLIASDRLGAGDRVHAATCVVNRIHTICSADAGFDSIDDVTRIDPLERAAMRSLRG